MMLQNSLVMSVVIIIMLILSRATRATVSARLRHVCWVVIAAGLLLPVRPVIFTVQMPAVPETERVNIGDAFTLGALPPLPIDDYAAAEAITAATTATTPYTTPYAKTGQAQAAPYSHVPPEHSTAGQPVTNSYQLTSPAAVPTPAPRSVNWQHLLLILWAAGAVTVPLVCVVRHMRFTKGIKRWAQPCTDSAVNEILDEVCAVVGVCRPRVMVSAVATPMVVGCLRPVLYLPHEALRGREQLRLMLLHEVMHIRRGDNFFRILSLVAVAVHWFNPLVYLMARALQTEAELACDAAVLRCAGDAARKEYGQAIFLTAKRAQRLSSLASAMSGEGKNLKRRLSEIIEKKHTRRALAVICAAVMIGGVVLAGMLAYERGVRVGADGAIIEIVAWRGDGVVLPDITNGYTPAEPLHITNPITLEPTDRLVIYLPAGAVHSQRRILDTVNAFRSRYPDVEVIVERLGDNLGRYSIDREAYFQRVSTEMMAGMGPDIVLTHIFDDIHRTKESGAFMNLSPLWHRDPDFEARDQLNPAIMDVGVFRGNRYVIPISFTMPLLVGERGMLESVGLPTDAEMDMASFFNAAAAAVSAAAENPSFLSPTIVPFGFPLYRICNIIPAVDFERSIALPYEDALRDFIQAYKQSDIWRRPDQAEWWDYLSAERAIIQGRTLFYPIVTTLEGISPVCHVFEPYSRIIYLGYEPYIATMRNHRGELHATVVQSLAVNANSPNYVNAWRFIRLLLTEQRQFMPGHNQGASGLGGGLPVNMIALDRHLRYRADSIGGQFVWTQFEGEVYFPVLTEEQIQPVLDLFTGITSASLRNQTLLNFMLEATQAYYEGTDTIDEIMYELGRRLRLYLAE